MAIKKKEVKKVTAVKTKVAEITANDDVKPVAVKTPEVSEHKEDKELSTYVSKETVPNLK